MNKSMDLIDNELYFRKKQKRKNAKSGFYANQNEQAITLVALIITIIVMLILAGVTLSLAFGENGIFSQSKLAVEKYEQARLKEEQEIQNVVNEMTQLGVSSNRDEYTITLTEEQLNQKINQAVAMATSGLRDQMCTPIRLTTIYLNAATRDKGRWLASSSNEFEDIVLTSDGAKYLTYTANTGFTVQKSGWYLFSDFSSMKYKSSSTSIHTELILNGSEIIRMHTGTVASNSTYSRQSDLYPLYLNEGTIIDYALETYGTADDVYGEFKIYAMFQ